MGYVDEPDESLMPTEKKAENRRGIGNEPKTVKEPWEGFFLLLHQAFVGSST